MPGETKNGMQCIEFDTLLSDALDQALTGARLEQFQAHARVCPTCGPLFAEAQAGKNWLKSLTEAEPPANLVHNILSDTVGIQSGRLRETEVAGRVPWTERVREWADTFMAPVVGVVRQPRFAMSFGMAFFSLSIALSVGGVKVSDLKQVDLRPSALRREYYTTTGKVQKYYENIRLVYEFESRVREFKKVATPAEPAPEEKDKTRRNDTSGQPEQRQERNYSQDVNQPQLASAPDDPTVVTVTTYRRDV